MTSTIKPKPKSGARAASISRGKGGKTISRGKGGQTTKKAPPPGSVSFERPPPRASKGKKDRKGGNKGKKSLVGWKKSLKGPLTVDYDPAARQEYLTGFQKRNQEKRAAAIAFHKKAELKALKDARREKAEAIKDKKTKVLADLEAIEKLNARSTRRASRASTGANDDEDETIEEEALRLEKGSKRVTVTVTEMALEDL